MNTEELIEFFIEKLGDNHVLGKCLSIYVDSMCINDESILYDFLTACKYAIEEDEISIDEFKNIILLIKRNFNINIQLSDIIHFFFDTYSDMPSEQILNKLLSFLNTGNIIFPYDDKAFIDLLTKDEHVSYCLNDDGELAETGVLRRLTDDMSELDIKLIQETSKAGITINDMKNMANTMLPSQIEITEI